MEQLQNIYKLILDLFAGKPYIQSAVAAVIAILSTYALTAVFNSVLLKLARRTSSVIDDKIIASAKLPFFYSILMIGLSAAIAILPASESFKIVVHSLFKTIGIIIWSVFFVRLAKITLRSSANRGKEASLVRPQTLPAFENVAFTIILAGAIFLAFQTWNIDMTAWLASAGVAGVAIGFAAKDTLSNLISGIFILADAPYKIGDYVVLDSGERGAITHIGIRSTRMLTRDDVELTIPNAIMGNTKIINESGGPYEKFRIRIPVGVAYGSDIDKVQEILHQAALDLDIVCKDPDPRVRFRAFGASSLDFELLCWVENPSLRGMVSHRLLCHIYKLFNREGVEIPYAKRDIYIKEMPRASLPE